MNIALLQILADRSIVGEVAIVHQGFVQANERMCAARVPDASLGGIAVMADPHVGMQVLDLVIADHVIAETDHLEHQQVPAVG